MEEHVGGQAPAKAANSLQGVFCMGATLILLPLAAYATGLIGLIALYFVAMGGLALLYAAQVFLTRQASLPLARGGPPGAPYSLEGKHVLVTGGSKGLGLALAMEAVRRGPSLVSLVARDRGALEEAQKACLKRADKLKLAVTVQIICADLLDQKAAIDCLEQAAALKGEAKHSAAQKEKKTTESGCGIDVLFCNAAYVDPQPFCSAEGKDISDGLSMNVTTPLLQVKHVLPGMIERGFGVICFSNSLSAYVPIYGLAAYSASKSALRAFTEALNQEVAGMGILVANAFLPSINTPGYEREKRVRHRLTEILESASKLKQPDEVAQSLVDHLEAGHRVITVDFEGWVCARLNAGFSRAESFASLFFEFLLGGVFR
ncbi:hypothetical protein Efla_000550 [Eimeria flavescens]